MAEIITKEKIDLQQRIIDRSLKNETDLSIARSLGLSSTIISSIRNFYGIRKRSALDISREWKKVYTAGTQRTLHRIDFSLAPLVIDLELQHGKKYEFKANKISKGKIEIIFREA